MNHPFRHAKPADEGQIRWPFPPVIVGLAWIISIGIADWLTGPELSLSAFYLPGVALVAWFSGRGQAIVMAFCAAIAWLLAELVSDQSYSSPLIPFWNATIRLSFFLTTALLTAEVRSRKKTEAALLEQDGILRSILNSMGDGVVVVGASGKIIVFNPAAESIFGGNAINRNALAWVEEVEQSNMATGKTEDGGNGLLQLAAVGKLPKPAEMTLRSSGDGSSKPVSIASLPLRGAQRQPAGVVMVISDLTSRRVMEKRIAEASEREQRRIGQDLHDGVCQHLVGVAFAAGTLQSKLESQSLAANAAEAGEIANLINSAISEARGLAHGLYPASLEEGLEIALTTLAITVQERTGIACSYATEGGPLQIEPTTATHLYRIAQECISNACRHGMPDRIEILLMQHAGQLSLSVVDNGKGMEESPSGARGIGISLMNYRSKLMGGSLAIQSILERGTKVTCTIPLEENRIHRS